MQLSRAIKMVMASTLFAFVSYGVSITFFPHIKFVAEMQSILFSIYMWIPGVFALVYMKKENIRCKVLQKPTKYVAFALAVPLALCALGIVATLPFGTFSVQEALGAARAYHINFGSTSVDLLALFATLYVVAAVASVTINFAVALGEELFWRGYLWEKLKSQGFWKASLYIGLLWGVWHAPIIMLFGMNYPEHRYVGVIWMVVGSVLLSPLMLYFRLQDKSLMAPTILHGMINAFLPLSVVFFPTSSELLRAPLGVAGFIALLVVNVCLLLSRIYPRLVDKEAISKMI